MTQKDQNRLTMWKAVRRYLDGNESIWGGNRPFKTAYEELTAAIEAADAAQLAQVVRTNGLTDDKDELEEEAMEQVDAIARSARAYALATKNHTLEAAVRYGKGLLANLPQAEQVKVMRTIVAAAGEHDTALTEYGITAAMRNRALEAIGAYEAAQPAARSTVATKSAATQSIPLTRKAARTALLQMDNLVHIFKNPDFTAGFRTARVVVDTGIRHEKPEA